jgi:molybdate transport system substrate-binding protein
MKIRIRLALAALLMQGAAVSAAEIKVLSAGGIRPLLQELIPQFEQASGHKIAITFVAVQR